MLYEYFNTTNQTSPHFEGHQNYVGDIKLAACSEVLMLPFDQRCHYVTVTESCKSTVHFFNYIHLVYCNINPRNTGLVVVAVVLLLFFCIVFYIAVGTTADSFFCPSLAMFAHILGLSENVAGVTLVAVGNGAPDIFSSIFFINSDERRLFADVFSSAMFVVFTVGGTIISIKPFKVQPYYFMRDALFLLLDVIFVDYIIKEDHCISAFESFLSFFIYIWYLFAVLMDLYLVKRATKRLENRDRFEGLSATDLQHLRALRSQGIITFSSLSSLRSHRSDTRQRVAKNALSADEEEPAVSPNHLLFKQFWDTIKQFNTNQWAKAGIVMRIFQLIRLPLLFILVTLLPKIDIDMEDHGWSKLLNCIQIVLLPACMCLNWFGLISFMKIPLIIYFLAVTVPLAIITFIITRTDTVPRFHKYFSVLGAMGSIYVLRICCYEIISILSVLSIATGLSSSFYGCTLLAWGNSMGDLMANVALARQGYQTMALAACFGGPLFSSLLAVGPILLWSSLSSSDFMIQDFGTGTMGENCSNFLKIGILSYLMGCSTCNFTLRASQGIANIIYYTIFLLFTMLCEQEIIHPYGSDHRMDQVLADSI